MCAVIFLRAGQVFPKEKLYNAVYNNWHSYGLVCKIDGRLEITKKVPESGEVDPVEVEEALFNNIDYDRYLHLRHNTAGQTSEENCHPFDVYFDPKSGRQIVFMHNGTLPQFKSKKMGPSGTMIDDDDGPSDTRNYVDQILIPSVAGMNFGNGHGDLHDPMFERFIKSDWTDDNNRGILIASDQKHLLLGKWKVRNFGQPDSNEERFLVSNDTYFDGVQRGPESERRTLRQKELADAARKKAEQERAERIAKGEGEVKGQKAILEKGSLRDLVDQLNPTYKLSTSAKELLSDFDFYDRAGTVSVGLLTNEEIQELYLHETDFINVTNYVFGDYYTMYGELCDVEEKHDKATKLIATQMEKIKSQDAEIKNLKARLETLNPKIG